MGKTRETSNGIVRFTKELNKAKIIALDTMIFSYQFLGEPKWSLFTQIVFRHVEEGKVKAIASPLALGEILTEIKATGEETDVREFVRVITTYPNLSFLPMDTNIAEIFADVRLQTKLHPADAIHIATAQYANADVLISNDLAWRKRFVKPKLILLGDYLK